MAFFMRKTLNARSATGSTSDYVAYSLTSSTKGNTISSPAPVSRYACSTLEGNHKVAKTLLTINADVVKIVQKIKAFDGGKAWI